MSADTLRIALVGNPNCGKTALFNLLTGGRQKVANYAGVTIERKEGRFVAPSALLFCEPPRPCCRPSSSSPPSSTVC